MERLLRNSTLCLDFMHKGFNSHFFFYIDLRSILDVASSLLPRALGHGIIQIAISPHQKGRKCTYMGEDVWGGMGSAPCRDVMVPVPPLRTGAVLACVVSRA